MAEDEPQNGEDEPHAALWQTTLFLHPDGKILASSSTCAMPEWDELIF